MSPSDAVHRRADARRNQEAIVTAAAEQLAIHGTDLQMTEIARAAGVSSATIFRHFATKPELIAAALETCFTRIKTELDRSLADSDPERALYGFMDVGCRIYVEDRLFREQAAWRTVDTPALRRVRAALYDGLDELVSRAQAAGVVRADLTADDISILLQGIGAAASLHREELPMLYRRYLSLAQVAIAPNSESTPLPEPGPSRKQMMLAAERRAEASRLAR